MTQEQLDVYSHAGNAAIVRMPERKFPGVLIQGDSLSSLRHLSQQLLRAAHRADRPLTVELADELHGRLSGYLAHYEQVLTAHGMELPYVRGVESEG